MAYQFAPAASDASSISTLLIDAARCWRSARDAGDPAQPSLTRVLRKYASEMLAPCLDSLMSLSQAALGRPLRVGDRRAISADERLLLELFSGAKNSRTCMDCGAGLATALDCALCSARIMVELARTDEGER